MVVEVLAVLGGALGAAWVVSSAVRTVVMPRPERVWLTMALFELARRGAHAVAARVAAADRRHRVLGAFGPAVLISLPLVWSLGLIASFAAVFWGLDVGSFADAVALSGSSLTTLGFVSAPTFATRMVAVVEALFGLAIVALMISFLPTIYGAFSRREIAVGRLTARAGEPPDPVQFIARLVSIDRLHLVGERWEAWEDWFDELGETHTTFPTLVYFRSAKADRSWLAAAEVALDTAALLSATELGPSAGQADTMIRSGSLALRAIADFFEIEPEPNLGEADLSVTRLDFDRALADLTAQGVTVDADRSEAWRAYRGSRVTYDRAVCGLRERIGDGPSHWARRAGSADDAHTAP